MKNNIKLSALELRSLAFGVIGIAYMGIGNVFSRPYRLFHIQNLTNARLIFSFDGINDHFPLPVYGYLTIDVTFNKGVKEGFYSGEGDRLYVKQYTALDIPTVGSVYITGFS